MALIFIFLIISFSIDFFSSVLTGSVTWEPTFIYVQGKTTMMGISQSSGGMSLYNYRKWEGTRIEVASLATAMGNMAWGSSNQSDHSAEPAMVMKRVMPKAQSLPVGSTLYNVTLPYFVVDNFEWIQDPNSYLTSEQYNLLTNYKNAGTHNRDYNPYTVGSGIVGLIPDKEWGPLSGDVTPDPQVVSETRILSYKFIRLPDHGSCEPMLPPGVPPNLGIITFQLSLVKQNAKIVEWPPLPCSRPTSVPLPYSQTPSPLKHLRSPLSFRAKWPLVAMLSRFFLAESKTWQSSPSREPIKHRGWLSRR
ncbi:hypothetical protein FRC19_001323 [Serendipita sp. 401]|nr:hypothetical protein FRC19_001323 [Serendipita sp. 401]